MNVSIKLEAVLNLSDNFSIYELNYTDKSTYGYNKVLKSQEENNELFTPLLGFDGERYSYITQEDFEELGISITYKNIEITEINE